jgi:pyrroline-5-carboxylate reductase
MGGADFVNVLYAEYLQYDPENPTWEGRDRFFLDPGHMSPMLYSQLALAGKFTIDELKEFRQWGSPTPGHPEVDFTRGIENSSGPLGQGHVYAVGAAIAAKFLAARTGNPTFTKETIYAYISDGGIQEEISQGAGRVAGHLGLDNLIMFFDSNDIQLSTETKDVISEDTVIWTIAAGITLEDMENYFGKKVKVVRTMPNTPAQVGAGVTGVTPNSEVTEADLEKVRACIEATGIMEVIPESLMDGIIPVTGSAPAFIFMLINAMADGAVREGFPRKQAIRLAAATVLGSAKMVLDTGKHPEALKDDVCTPGGITIEMVKKMEEVGFRNAVLEGMEACH